MNITVRVFHDSHSGDLLALPAHTAVNVPWSVVVGGEEPEKEKRVATYFMVVGVVVPNKKLWRTVRRNDCDHKGIKKTDKYCYECGARANIEDEKPIDGFDNERMEFADELSVVSTTDDESIVGVCEEGYCGSGDMVYDMFSMDEVREATKLVRRVMKKTGLVKNPEIGVHLHVET